MEVAYIVTYHEDVLRDDIPALPKTMKIRIKKAIEEKLMTAPDLFGKPLWRDLIGMKKLRVGDYRIVFCIQKKTVRILSINHRSIVYDRKIEKRLEK